MSIDLMTNGIDRVIIVGDQADLGEFVRVENSSRDSRSIITLVSRNGLKKSFDIGATTERADSPAAMARRALLIAEFAAVVLLDDERIVSGDLVPIDDSETPVQPIAQPELKRFAEDTVSGQFLLLILQARSDEERAGS